MIRRRDFLALGAAPAAGALPASGVRHPIGAVKTRHTEKVEIAFPSPPGSRPNGLQATSEGLWIIDQGEGSKAYLVSYEDGRVLRSFPTDTDRSSGITYENGTLWIGSTYSREIVHCDAMTGKTIQRYFTPGAGVIYQMVGDPPARSSPLERHEPEKAQKKAGSRSLDPSKVGGFQAGQLLGSRAPGTGAHGQEWRDGKLWMAVPPARMIFCLDPKTWVVQKRFDTAGNRPHGIGWEGRYLWCTDSNLNAFFKHDPETGEIVEKIQLADTDPLPHGMTIWQGTLWYCDDVGVVCRLKM
jgi:outer membrane protein assembly factor BamB